MSSIFKLIEKEKDNDVLGLGKDCWSSTARKRPRPWEKAIAEEEESKSRKRNH